MLLSLAIWAWPWQELKASKPNIILIVADYMGYSDIGPFGAKDIQTPGLNELAEQGVRFSNYYAAAPICIPSRAALMSGLYPDKVLKRLNYSRGLGLPSEKNNLLKGLKAAGYQTALIGKWHLGNESNFKPNDHGFDYFFGFDSWTLGYHDHLTSTGEPGLYRNDQKVQEDGYLTDMFSQEAVSFLSNTSKPFFLYLAYNAGLPPYQKPDLAQSEWDSGWDANSASRDDYVAMIESMDKGIERVLEKLKSLGLSENTLVVFTYDHGGRHFADSGPLFHGFSTVWEGGIRVPLIIRWPEKITAGKLIDTPAIAMDLTATMLQAADGESSIESLDGINLLPLKQNMPDKERTFYWRRGSMKAVRMGQWKYVVDRSSQFLFDLSQDTGERKNQFSSHPQIVKQLKQALENWERSLRAFD